MRCKIDPLKFVNDIMTFQTKDNVFLIERYSKEILLVGVDYDRKKKIGWFILK